MRIKEGYVIRTVGDKHIVIPIGEASIEFKGIMTLNESGALLFQALKEDVNEAFLVNKLMSTYDVDDELAKKDVETFIEKLRKHQLLENE